MNFEYSDKVEDLRTRLTKFMEDYVLPQEQAFDDFLHSAGNRFVTPPFFKTLQEKAREQGLWNLFLAHAKQGAGLTNLEYAPLAEIMGQVFWAPEIFNCNAPDTGNMETLTLFGTDAQQDRWLKPLLDGKIRSAFCMTEPDVASSDATNIQTSIKRDGDEYVVNGKKWYATGGMRESCEILIVMGKTDPDNPNRHQQQSMVLVPKNTPGIRIVRHLTVLGYDDAPYGEAEIIFENVRVPVENILLGEGRGFEIAQGRLGPGRIHHCMRQIGAAQRALNITLERVEQRSTFGKKLSEHQSVREDIAKSFCEIEQARLLTLKAADRMDKVGNKAAKDLIAAIKIVAPTMAFTVLDRAIQIQGGRGLCQDTPLAHHYVQARTLKLADGPDQVHMMALGRQLIREYHQV